MTLISQIGSDQSAVLLALGAAETLAKALATAMSDIVAILSGMLSQLNSQGEVMTHELIDLQARVTNTIGLMESGMTLMSGLSQLIKDNIDNPAGLRAIAASLDEENSKFASALAANAVPPPPTDTPAPPPDAPPSTPGTATP